MSGSSVQVSALLAGLLERYLDAHAAHAPALREELAALGRQQRMPIETWWRLLREVERHVPDPATGLAIGLQAELRDLGVLGYLAAACSTLGQVLERFQRYQPLIHNLSLSKLIHHGDTIQISWDSAYGISTRLSDQVLVAAMLTVTRRLVGASFRLASVTFFGPPRADISVYEERLGCPVRFGAQTLDLYFPIEALTLPINTSDPYLMELMEQQAQALVQAIPQPDALLTQLQQVLVDILQEGEPTCERVAAQIGIPERTLYRRLRERGFSYKGILTDLRKQLALRYLADANLSLPEIAQLLGYSEQSAFTRAFGHWFGVTPLRHRQTSS